ncbi:MAG: hypothetical protein C0417_07575 [Chlorobiaceae bacterium]|nr:hypothetical protein [Chlorobiaceae bacterium]
MEYSEIKKLIPFYIAGTLEPDEKKLVEDALRDSGELKKEFEFWLKAKEVTARHALRLAENHLTPEQIVGYLERYYESDKLGLESIESHLRTCVDCRSDIEMIRSTYPVANGERQKQMDGMPEKLMVGNRLELILSKKFVDVFAIAAVIFIVALTLVTNFNIDNKLSSPEKQYASLVLRYQNSTRGNERIGTTNLIDDPSTSGARVLLYIPHSKIDSLRYEIILKNPLDNLISIETSYKINHPGNILDTLQFIIDRKYYANIAGKYLLFVKEKLPPDLSDITPEQFIFIIDLKNEKRN